MYGDTVCHGAIKFVMVTNTGVEHFYGLTHPFVKGWGQSVAQSCRFWHINLSRDGNVCRVHHTFAQGAESQETKIWGFCSLTPSHQFWYNDRTRGMKIFNDRLQHQLRDCLPVVLGTCALLSVLLVE